MKLLKKSLGQKKGFFREFEILKKIGKKSLE